MPRGQVMFWTGGGDIGFCDGRGCECVCAREREKCAEVVCELLKLFKCFVKRRAENKLTGIPPLKGEEGSLGRNFR